MLPKQIQQFIEIFSKLPAIGPRMARRLAIYLITLDDETYHNIEKTITDLKNIDHCPRCFFIKNKENKLCQICSKKERDKQIIAIVEKETDVLSLEKTSNYKGTYFIIGPSNGTGPLTKNQKIKIKHLINLLEKAPNKKIEEIIVATNPNSHGDYIAGIIKKECKKYAKKITRLGRGLPTGGEIEFADQETLSKALEHRGE